MNSQIDSRIKNRSSIPVSAIVICSLVAVLLLIALLGGNSIKSGYKTPQPLVTSEANIEESGFGYFFNDNSSADVIEKEVSVNESAADYVSSNYQATASGFIYLSSLDSCNNSHGSEAFEYYDSVTDNYGTIYSSGIGGSDSDESWNEYMLDGSTYKEIRGKVVLNYEARTQTSDDVFLWIYGDNIVLFMSQPITAGCEPQEFNVDLTGVKTLKVVIRGRRMLRLVDCGLYTDSSISTISTAVQSKGKTQSRIYLTDMEWFNASDSDGGFIIYDSVKDNFGTLYANGLGGNYSGDDHFQEYLVNGSYAELRGRVVLNYDYRTQTSDDVFLWVYGDGDLLFQSHAITAGCEPQDFIVDINGVSKLKVVIRGRNMLRLVDCCLYVDSSISAISTAFRSSDSSQNRIYLSDMEWFNASDSDGGFIAYDSVKDNYGNIYANGLGGNYSGSEHFEEYALNSSYTEMNGRVVLDYDARTQTSDDVYLWIYADGNLVYQSQPVTAGCDPQDFTIDLTGVNKLKVVIRGRNMLRLVDCILYK